MKDEELYKQIAEEAGSDYMKGYNDNGLKLIKDFRSKINNDKINNKDTAVSKFRELKQKVNNDRLKQDLIKDLETSLFGENLENIKQKRTFAPSSPPKEDYSTETIDYMKYQKEQEKGQKRFSDDYDSNGWFSGSGLKILTNKCLILCLYY